MTDDPSYRLYLEEKFRGIEQNANAHFVAVEGGLSRIEEHLKKQNGTIAELQKESDKRQKVVDEFHEFKNRFVMIKKKWVWLLLGSILFVVTIQFLYDIGAITEIILKIIDKAS